MGAVSIAPMPALMIIRTLAWRRSIKQEKKCEPLEGHRASLIEQILSSMRVVASFGVGEKLLKKSDDGLGELLSNWKQRAIAHATNDTINLTVISLMNALAFCWGTKLMLAGELTLAQFINVSALPSQSKK